MALTSFLRVNGVDFPCPRVGFNYIISTTVDSGRNANNEIIGQKVGRDLYKLNELEWAALPADVWQKMLKAVEPFFIPVTFEDYRTAKPLFVDPVTHKVTKYENCKFNLIDCGWD